MYFPNHIGIRMSAIRDMSIRFMALFVVLYMVVVTAVNLIVFRLALLEPITSATGGLVNGTLVVNIINLLVFVGFGFMRLGKMSYMDLGLDRRKIMEAVAITVSLWGLIQLSNIMIATAIRFNDQLLSQSWSTLVGAFLGQLLGNALFEEIAFRGFLMVQICKKFQKNALGLGLGIGLSQLIFTVIHIPNRIYNGYSFIEMLPGLAVVFLIGLLLSWLYIITGNLWLAVGLHTLANTPMVMIEGGMTFPGVVFGMMILPMIWDRIERQKPLRALETDRLRLREWRLDDAEDLYDYARSELVGPSAGWPMHKSIQDSRRAIQTFMDNGDSYAVELKAKGKVVGCISLYNRCPDDKFRVMDQRELGYVLNPSYWGQGIMPEAVERVKAYCFQELKIDMLWCGHFEGNDRSKSVIEKTGFKYVRSMEKYLPMLGNRRVMTHYYAILRE